MIDNNIKRFCELLMMIKVLNDNIDQIKRNFCNESFPFEDCCEYELKKLEPLQEEFKTLLKEIIKQ